MVKKASPNALYRPCKEIKKFCYYCDSLDEQKTRFNC